MALQSAALCKLFSLCRYRLATQGFKRTERGKNFKSFVTRQDLSNQNLAVSTCFSQWDVQDPNCGGRRLRRSIVTQAKSSQRWTLDDVERISKGKASKAKTGSRAVPHRLQAQERKAYELAKRKGYLVQRALSRRYPLVNTYRNFCNASNQLCIFIEQGQAGTDTVVIDLTPLQLSEGAQLKLLEQLTELAESVMRSSPQDSEQVGEEPSAEDDVGTNNDIESISSSSQEHESEEGGGMGEDVVGILRFISGRSEAKSVCQAVWDFWQAGTKKEERILSV